MTGRGTNSGMALVIVLTVLLALALIATPFVLSMVLQEKTATLEKEQKRAAVETPDFYRDKWKEAS